MRIITIDFETYWNSKEKYSLAKMGRIEYIRDSRFYVQCMGFRIDHGQTFVVPAGHIRKTINALRLDEPGTIVVGHNINGFDALVLSEHYGVRPYMIIDTISMMNWLGLSRVMSCSHKTLTAALGHGVKQAGTVVSDGKKHISDFAPEDWKFFMRYCADDVIQCSENFFTMLPMVTNSDALRLMSITAKMATEPVFVPDEAMLDEYVKKLDADTEAKRNELSHIFNFENSEAMLKAIRSRSQFPKLLESLGCPCPMKWSEKQQKNIPAISKTDLEFTALLEHSDERVVALVRARLEQNSSIQKSRANNLLTFSGKPIPIMLGVYKAHTGRYTAGNEGTSDGLNFQNLSKRDPSKLAIRESIKAPAGYKVVACDSSQIEARILAWVAGQEDLVEQFRDGRDPYAEMASKIFGQTAQEIHDGAKRGDHPQHDKLKMERNVGKTCILSCLGADTEVLTDTGWKTIIKVSLTDKLWDGEQWVNHTGLSYNGMKKTIELDGLRLTADHLIWNGTTWNVAKDYLKEPSYIVSAVKYATESLETLGLSNIKMNCGLKNTNTRVEPVYDLLNAGPNHRFTVRTKHGAMIVHNCGYGVSAQKFSDTLLRSNVQLDDNLEQHAAIAAHAHAVYRQASFGITSFWKQCDRVVRMLASTDKIGQLGTFGAHNEFIAGRDFIPGTQTNCAYLQLPNGYRLWYPNLRMYETQVIYDRIVHGKPTVTRIYGAGAVENLCQSYAFMMLGWQACRMQERGIDLKANIHDAWITVVPEDKAEETKRIMEECMSAVPDWLAGFPVGCEAEIGDDFRIA